MLRYKEHIAEHLQKLTANASEEFNLAFHSLNISNKTDYKDLLIYLDKVLARCLEGNEFKYLNLHIEGINESIQSIITQFLVIRSFYSVIKTPSESDTLSRKIFELDRTLTYRYKETPSYVSGKKLSKRAKIWMQGKMKVSALLKFYRALHHSYGDFVSFAPRTIVNLLAKEHQNLSNSFESTPYAISLAKDSRDSSCVLLNSELCLNDIDGITLPDASYLFDQIQNIFIIGCEGKKLNRSFSYRELSRLNQSGKLKGLVVVSFSDQKVGFNKLKARLERIMGLYHSIPKFPDYNSYLIPEVEIGLLLGKNGVNEKRINFFGTEQSSFWDDFKALVNRYEGLYELRSLKMMNIYSLALSNEIRDLILVDLFDFGSPSILLTENSREELRHLSKETIDRMKSSLYDTLSFIITSGWPKYLVEQINVSSTIIISHCFKNNDRLVKAFTTALQLTSRTQIQSWLTISLDERQGSIVVLDYRDAGRFPYTIRPNLIELSQDNWSVTVCHFLNVFFKSKYDWACYNYSNDSVKLLKNDIRVDHFALDLFARNIKAGKPSRDDTVVWDIEHQLEPSRSLQTIKIGFQDGSRRSYQPSELFIVRNGSISRFTVTKAMSLLDEDLDDDLFIQMMNEIHSGFNIYEKIANKDREEKELQFIKTQYKLNKAEKAERLWKILLKRKGQGKSLEELYSEVQSYLHDKGSHLVSIGTFEDHWINADSDTLIPRERRAFFLICEYLGLPNSYFTIMVRLKNVEVQNSRDNSRQMNSLLSDLINAGCFNDGVDTIGILEGIKKQLQRRHNLNEIGFNTDTLVEDLHALVELLKPFLNLSQVREIELT